MRNVAVICFMVFSAVILSCSKENAPANAPIVNSAPISTSETRSDKPQIIAFGDSLTAGFGLADPNQSYPSLLQRSLISDGFDYRVVNLGLGGETSAGGLKRLWFALKYKNVRVFILELGANDVVKKTPAAEIKANLAEIIKQVKATDAKVILCGIAAPPEFGDVYDSEVREMYAALAKENELPLIADFMKNVRGNPERMIDDKIHPNEKGVEIIEQNVLSVVKELLGKNNVSQGLQH